MPIPSLLAEPSRPRDIGMVIVVQLAVNEAGEVGLGAVQFL